MRVFLWRRERINALLTAAGMGIACFALFRWPRAAAAGVSRGLATCGQILIPSLLPLLVLTNLFCRCFSPGRRISRFTAKLFRLPGICALPLLMGAVGGYPAGAAAIRSLLDAGEMDETTAKKVLPFCIGAGPAFLIGTVGAVWMGSTYKGVILYACHVAASLLMAWTGRKNRSKPPGKNLPPVRPVPLFAAFSGSVSAALETLLGICGFVLLFAAFFSVCDASGLAGLACSVMNYPFTLFGIPLDASPLWPALWEVSAGVSAAANAPLPAPVCALFIGTAAGWAGLSVHCQIRNLFRGREEICRGLAAARAGHALLGGVLSFAAFSLLPMPPGPEVGAAVWSTAVTGMRPVTVSAAAAGALLLLCGVFLLTIDRFKA